MQNKRIIIFADTILRTLKGDGNVLLPVDTAGRILELILILEQVILQDYDLMSVSNANILNHILVFTVLDTTSPDLSYLLSHKCILEHD